MAGAVIIVQTPGLAARVLYVLEVGDACVVVPDLTSTPWAYIENMVKGRLDDAAVTNSHDYFPLVLVH